MAQYIIQPGDTLTSIARKNNLEVADLQNINNIADPNKIQAGSPITLPDMANTLNKADSDNTALAGVGEGSASSSTQRTLPNGSASYLANFRTMLKSITNKAAQQGMASGAAAMPEGMPEASQVSGNTFASILGTVARQKTLGVKDIYTATTDLLDQQQKAAENQLQMLISTGAIATMDDAQLARIGEATSTPIDYLKTIKEAKIKQQKEDNPSDEDMAQDISDYTDLIISGRMDLFDVPVTDRQRLEVGNTLNQIYSNPVAKQVEVWKAKKQRFLSEGSADSSVFDPGTREDLIRSIASSEEMTADTEGIQKIKDIVYALVPDVWEINIQKRWKPSESSSGFTGKPVKE